MDALTGLVAQIRIALAARLPGRLIADDFINHAHRHDADLLRGVVTVLVPRLLNEGDWTADVEIKIVGQIKVPDRDTTAQDVERAEFRLWHELRRALRNMGPGIPKIETTGCEFSAQLEHPFGWVALTAKIQDLELDTGDIDEDYPPTMQVGQLKTVYDMIDIPPHASAAVHERWAAEQPVEPQPDVTDVITIPEKS